MHQEIDKKNKIFCYIFLFILLTSINNKSFLKRINSLLKINNIEINGLSESENFKLSNKFKLLLFQNIFLVNNESFEEILDKNNLIQSFNIKKNYPNSILINIKKTDFLALTNFNNEKYIIASNGKLIKYENIKETLQELPYVFGKMDYSNFIIFKKIIDKSKFDYKNINSLYYFPNKRWNIKTNNNVLIKLPDINILDSLNIAKNIISNKNFINKDIIDLRISNYIITSNE
jgi:cell division septal protein FtsQ